MEPGLLLILSAPSGGGKTTLAHMLMKAYPDRAMFSVSYTTRATRGQERDGIDYHFVDQDAFKAMIDRGELVEWAEVHGRRIVVFDIDVQGGTTIKSKHPEAVSVFVLPPSMQELERRLRARQTDSEEVIRKRLLAARAEIERGCESYDYLIVNREIERAFGDLEAIVRAERCRRGRVDLAPLGLG
jgi:guanylate kinase